MKYYPARRINDSTQEFNQKDNGLPVTDCVKKDVMLVLVIDCLDVYMFWQFIKSLEKKKAHSDCFDCSSTSYEPLVLALVLVQY